MVKAVPGWIRAVAVLLAIAIGAYMLLPIIVVAISSVNSERFLSFPPKGFSLQWYEMVLTTDTYLQPFLTSLWIGLLVTAVAVVVGTAASIALTRFQISGSQAILSFLMAPIIVPSIILGIALLAFLSVYAGGASLGGIIIGHIVLAIPYVVRTVSGVLLQQDRFTEEAARTMGANWWQRYLLVLLPMCKSGIFAGAFFAFNISFDDAVVALFLRSPSVETLPLAIYGRLEFSPDPSVAAVSTLMVLVTVLVLIGFERTLGLGKVMA